MGVEKFNGSTGHNQEAPQHTISRALYEDEAQPLDLDVHGGIVVLDTGQLAEVVPLKFIPEGGNVSLDGPRVQPLPFDVDEDGEITWRAVDYDPARPSIGFETESLTMRASNAEWWNISPDGTEIHYPHGLAVEPADARGHQPEQLKNTTESGSPVHNLSYGPEEFVGNAEDEKYYKQVWMVENGLLAVPLSAYPDSVKPEDITEHPYIEMLGRIMPRMKEYAACLSEQINIQWRNPESGAFALNAYEMLGPVLGLVTAASPARDGSLSTTLRQHYEQNQDFMNEPNPEDYVEMAEQVNSELGSFMDQVPYDWRELARGYGSVIRGEDGELHFGGGVIQEPAPLTVDEFLKKGDQQLRNSEAMTINRVLGPHSNRWRPDKGVIEISNLSLGGDHPDKMAAVEEVVIKTIIALQEYYVDPNAEENYERAWADVIPTPYERYFPPAREKQVDVARVNNMIFTMFGKDRKMFDSNWQEISPKEIFDVFDDFISAYSPEPLSHETFREITSTLRSATEFCEDEHSINDSIASFYQKESNLTATEALRSAEPLDNMDPPITLNQIYRRFATYAYRKRMERHDAKKRQLSASAGAIALSDE